MLPVATIGWAIERVRGRRSGALFSLWCSGTFEFRLKPCPKSPVNQTSFEMETAGKLTLAARPR
jgi:hypothetical protein